MCKNWLLLILMMHISNLLYAYYMPGRDLWVMDITMQILSKSLKLSR